MMDTVTLPDRDKAITREDIEREIRLLENNASDCHVRTETVAMLRALSARVEELEAENAVLKKPLYGSFNKGRLQGLDEAAQVAAAKYKAPPKGIHGFQGDMHVAGLEISKAIEALKGEATND